MKTLTELGCNAARAKYEIQGLRTEEKNAALEAVAAALRAGADEILAANESDLKRGEQKK